MPRSLPHVAERHRIYVPDVGNFTETSVGNTSWTTGLDIHVHLLGAEEPLFGYVRHHIEVTPEFKVVWVQERPTVWASRSPVHYTPAILAHMQRIADTYVERDATSYMFHVIGAIGPELDRHRLAIRRLEEMIEFLEKLLADPRLPLSTAKFPVSEEDRVHRREGWVKSLARDRKKLAELLAGVPRIERLKAVDNAMGRWCWTKDRRGKPGIAEVIDRSLKGDLTVTEGLATRRNGVL